MFARPLPDWRSHWTAHPARACPCSGRQGQGLGRDQAASRLRPHRRTQTRGPDRGRRTFRPQQRGARPPPGTARRRWRPAPRRPHATPRRPPRLHASWAARRPGPWPWGAWRSRGPRRRGPTRSAARCRPGGGSRRGRMPPPVHASTPHPAAAASGRVPVGAPPPLRPPACGRTPACARSPPPAGAPRSPCASAPAPAWHAGR
jgi:hypothetical protein